MGFKESLISALAPFASAAPYHLLVYGTLIGTELYQSFVMTKICYQVLPISAFTTLQKKVFPAYFRIQTLLIFLTAVTHVPSGPFSLVTSTGDIIPLAFAGGMALLNLTIYGPKTQEAMIERIHQETRDGRKHDDVEATSEEMRKLNRKFSKNHAMSIHLNLLAIGATLWYGVRLASRIQINMV